MISQINPGAGTLGAAVNTEVALIGVVSLPATVPLPIPYPYVSSGVIHTDLAKAIGQIDTTGGVNLGQAITNGVNKIGISSTHTPTPVIPNPLFSPHSYLAPCPLTEFHPVLLRMILIRLIPCLMPYLHQLSDLRTKRY